MEKSIYRKGLAMLIGVNLTRNGRLETASTQTKPADPGFKSLIFPQSAQADFACVAANSIRQGLN